MTTAKICDQCYRNFFDCVCCLSPMTAEQRKAEASSVRVDHVVMWHTDSPPEGVMLWVRGSDCMGGWKRRAMRKDYTPPPKGQKPKGYWQKKGWRWVDAEGNRFVDQVEAWTE